MTAPATALDKARGAWGADLPAWVAALAREVDLRGTRKTATRVGISTAAVSQIVRRVYAGSYARTELKVRARLLSESVECSVLGLIRLDLCLDTQGRGLSTASPQQLRLSRTCPGCQHGGGPRCGKAV